MKSGASSPSVSLPDVVTLRHYPDPVLRRVCKPVTSFDADLRRFIDRMHACMEQERGVGLAAPQVGVSLRLFVTNHTASKPDLPPQRRAWINPRLERTEGTTVFEEGCLSFPGIYAPVERIQRFDIVFQDERGGEQRLHLDHSTGDLLAIVVQHELDHLDGKVFVDHVPTAQLPLIRRRLKELEKDYKKATGSAGTVLRR